MAQTSYSNRFAAALEGMLSKGEQNANALVDSAVAGTTSASIPFGRWVTRDGADKVAKLTAAAADVTTHLLGLALRNPSQEPQASDGGVLGHAQHRMLPVMVLGRAFVLSETAVAYGDPVYARITSDGGSNTALGTSRNDPDTASSVDRATKVPGARFIQTIAAPGLVEIERYAVV